MDDCLEFKKIIKTLLIWILCISPVVPALSAYASLSVVTGPTTIVRGDATGARDITVSNDWFAIAIAVDTAPPWGVARGGIVDIALIDNGVPGFDIASLADFMPNQWSSWPTTYQHVSIEQQTPNAVVIKTLRDWGQVELETRFTIKDDDRKIHIVTRMTNRGAQALKGLMSGYIVWPDGGHLFGVPGLPAVHTSAETQATARWSAAYDENWVLGLHAPFSETSDYGGRDRYQRHNLQPGQFRDFEAWLQIENSGSLAPLVQTEINFSKSLSGRVAGTVTDSDGSVISQPAVIVLKNNRPYSWALGTSGTYEFVLPVGTYQIYATARGYAQGTAQNVVVRKNQLAQVNFSDVQAPGTLHLSVHDKQTDAPLDARISIKSGYKPLIAFFGRNTFFTELDRKGEIEQIIAPGNYELKVSAGGGFMSLPQTANAVIASGQTAAVSVAINVLTAPNERGWFSADLHHHSDVLDGFTEAAFVLRSELAAGVDLAFLSDHDSIQNNQAMQSLASQRGMLFIPGTEMSPSWAHFNAYPLDPGKTINIDTGQATVQQVFAAARDMGADVIEVNHPYSRYGYFESLDATVMQNDQQVSAVPGGYNPNFDLVEIIPDDHAANAKTLRRVWELWNQGQKAYLAAGSDVHNVWLNESGSARTFVFVDGDLSIDKFIRGLKAGNSFATQGPLVYPEILFGSEVHHTAGNSLELAYTFASVSGLKSIKLIERGKQIDQQGFAENAVRTNASFLVNPASDTWYSLVIENNSGNFAYTNPVWVKLDTQQGFSLLALILTIAMAITMLTSLVLVTRWRNVICTGVTPVSFFTFIAILFTSGLDVGLIMFPLVDFQAYASESAYSFTDPLAIEFGFWGFLVWSFYFLTTFYFCIIEPRLKLFEIPAIKLVNNLVTFGTCAFTAYLFLIYLPDYVQGISDTVRYGLVALVILFATVSSTDIKFVKILSVSSTWLFFALIFAAWLASGMGITQLASSLASIGSYFSNIEKFISPITDYHQFYLYWWFAWSIMIGQFVARFVSNMKAWKLLLALLVVPSIPIAIWFSILYYYFSHDIEIGPYWRLAMVIVGVIFVINSLDSLIRLYTQNLGFTTERFSRSHYIVGNWVALSALVVLYKFTPLKIEWIGLVVIGLYIAIYALVFKKRHLLGQRIPEA